MTTPAVHGGAWRATGTLALGLALAQGIQLAATPVWSRLYTPADFAALGLWTAVVAVGSMALTLRFDAVIVPERDEAAARGLLRLCLLLALGGGALLAVATALLPAAWLARAGFGPLAAAGWAALPGAVLAAAGAAALAAALAWANRGRQWRRMSAARIGFAAVAAGAGIALGVGGVAGGLLWAHAAAAAAALALAWPGREPLRGDAALPARAVAARHADSPRYLWPAALLDALTQQLPLWLIVLWFGDELAGQFGLAWRVAALPALMAASAAGSVFLQRFAEVAAADRGAARTLLLATWRRFAWIAFAPALLLAAFGAPLFGWVFGAAWAPAGQMAALLVPMLFAMAVSSPTSGALIVLGLQRLAPRFGLAMLVYRPACFAIGAATADLALALSLWAGCEIAAIVVYNRLLWRALPRAAAPKG